MATATVQHGRKMRQSIIRVLAQLSRVTDSLHLQQQLALALLSLHNALTPQANLVSVDNQVSISHVEYTEAKHTHIC